jgi:putative Holliday junction resolvase
VTIPLVQVPKENNVKSDVQAPILALDLGAKRNGAAVSDALAISIRRLEPFLQTNWKQTLRHVETLIREFDAQTVVIGLPLRLNGSEGDAATKIRSTAEKFARSLPVPVYLQDERLTSAEAEERLRAEGRSAKEVSDLVDSEAALLILRDFLVPGQKRVRVQSAGANPEQIETV